MRENYLLLFVFLSLSIGIVLSGEPSDKTGDIFSGVSKGTRIKITLQNGNFVTGVVKIILPEQVILDISYEETLGKGTIGVAREEIDRIELLEQFDEARKRKILQEKEEQLKEYRKKAELERLKSEMETKTSTPETTESRQAGTKTEIDAETLLKRFPPESGWEEKKYHELTQKDAWKLTPLETEFLENYTGWKEAVAAEAKKKRRALLEKFPPGDQWNEKKYKELTLQLPQKGFLPNDLEQEFMANFKDWQKAVEERREEEARKEKEKTAAPTIVSPETPQPQPPEETPPTETTEEEKK